MRNDRKTFKKPSKSGPYNKSWPVWFTYQPRTMYRYTPKTGIWDTIGTDASIPTTSWKTKSGVWNPAWREMIGKQPVNSPYSLDLKLWEVVDTCDVSGYRQVMWWDDWGRPIYGTEIHRHVGLPYPSSSLWSSDSTTLNLSSADNRAKLDVMSKIKEEYTKFQGGTFINELRQTISMIRKPGKALWAGVEKYLTEVPKKLSRMPSPRQTLRNTQRELRQIEAKKRVLRETWLEMSYGWQPLLQDIKGAAEAAAEMSLTYEREASGLRTIRSKRIRTDPSFSKQVTERNLDVSYAWTYPYDEVATRIEKAWVMYSANCSRELLYPKNELQKLVQLSGFSLREWVPTLWNCIPYSFLVDYFTNVGDVIEFYSTDKSSIKGLTKTTKYEIETLIRNVGRPNAAGVSLYRWTSSQLGALKMSRTLFTRTLVDPVLLDVRFEWENPLPSGKKLFNMAALASQFWSAKLSLTRR